MLQQYTYSSPAGNLPYVVYTPLNYRADTPVPLLVMLHGCTQSAADFAAGTQMNLVAEEHNFIVVYPQQVRKNNSLYCWNWFDLANQSRDHGEPAMIVGIVQDILQNTAQWTIDTARIYVAGISAGAAMSVILGATYPDIFAAIGIHSGLEYQALKSHHGALTISKRGGPDPLQQGLAAYEAMGSYARIVPTIVFHGTKDTVINITNGDQVVQQWMQTDMLASHDTYVADFNAPATATTYKIPTGYAYTVYTWQNSRGKTIQEYWKVNGLGHAWSGGNSSGSYTDSRGPSASEALYAFFMHHSMHRKAIHPTAFFKHVLHNVKGLLPTK
ncbi:MAG: PHB depolymerase family esterase [Chloroflexota bacterium]|nr:MAG: PHB depolymerase family esterase [Chloroflexota bacterium]